LGLGITIFAIAITLMDVNATRGGEFWNDMVKQHFVSTVWLPAAVVTSLTVVLILRTMEGDIALKFSKEFELRGASGPIIMWVICFLTLVLAVRLTWDLR
jgi:hypothetical protein